MRILDITTKCKYEKWQMWRKRVKVLRFFGIALFEWRPKEW